MPRQFAKSLAPCLPQLHLPFLLAACMFCAATIAAQTNPPPQDAPVPASHHKPVSAEDDAKYEAAIAPYIQKARDSLPDAKKRFQAGLPQGQILYVTIRLSDSQGRFEEAYVKVNSWTGTVIKGTLASDMDMVKKYKNGDSLTCRDSQVMDWTISKPDGTAEGNLVGKFLETYKPDK